MSLSWRESGARSSACPRTAFTAAECHPLLRVSRDASSVVRVKLRWLSSLVLGLSTAACGSDGSSGTGASGGNGSGGAAAIASDFDEAPGANTYFGLEASNWVGSSFHAPRAGTQLFASGNGSPSAFEDLGLMKDLGGKVANQTYKVSFYMVQPDDGQASVELSDFKRLRIGGPAGTLQWTATPTSSGPGQWVQWQGTYTPAPSDVGGPFVFDALFDLASKHSVGLDGPMVAEPE